jgi:hypothetical protein
MARTPARPATLTQLAAAIDRAQQLPPRRRAVEMERLKAEARRLLNEANEDALLEADLVGTNQEVLARDHGVSRTIIVQRVGRARARALAGRSAEDDVPEPIDRETAN